MLTRASRLVSAVTSFPVQYNKAIVGRNAFAHESGIHQDGMLKNAQTYEIMTPESVGVSKTSLVMGKHSGRNAFRTKLKELGYELGDNAVEDAFNRFKALADRKKHVYDEDIEALVDQEIASAHDRIRVLSLTVIAGTMGPQSATHHARHRRRAQDGAGDRQRPGRRDLQRHQGAGAARGGAGALPGERRHRGHRRAGRGLGAHLQEDGRTVTGRAADTDTLVASAKAYRLGAEQALGQARPHPRAGAERVRRRMLTLSQRESSARDAGG